MQQIITNEFIQYKSGFIVGKHAIIEAFKLGKIFSLQEESESIDDTSWYGAGYVDGVACFSKFIDDNCLNLEEIDTQRCLREGFTNRVLKKNEDGKEQIPIGKFKI